MKYKTVETPPQEYPISFQEEKSRKIDFVSKDSPGLDKVSGIKDYIFVSILYGQDKNCLIKKYSLNLEMKAEYVLIYGQGPGEIINPRIYGGDTKSIVVFDNLPGKFLRYTPEFEYITQYKSPKNRGCFTNSGGTYIPRIDAVLDGYHLYFNQFKGIGHVFVRRLMPNGTIEDQKIFEMPIINFNKESKYQWARPFHFGCFFNAIYILDKEKYIIIKRDINGNLLTAVKISFKKQTFSKSLRKEWKRKWLRGDKDIEYRMTRYVFPENLWPAFWMMEIGNGIAVGRCNNYDRDETPVTADYFDPDLNYLGKIKLPYFDYWNHPSIGQKSADNDHYYKNGKFYTIRYNEEPDEYFLVRWDVKIGK